VPTHFIVFDKRQRRADMHFESGTLSRASSDIDILADRAGLKMLLDYTHVDLGEFASALPPGARQIPQWFPAQEGLDWITAVIQALQKRPSATESPERVLADLARCREVLQRASAAGLRWRFGVDH
jgi:hypothetical protein